MEGKLAAVMLAERSGGKWRMKDVMLLFIRGVGGKFLAQKKQCFDKESLVSALWYIGLPRAHTCQPAAGGAPSIPLPSS